MRKILILMIILFCGCIILSDKTQYNRGRHSNDYNRIGGIFMDRDVEEYTEENVATIVLGHCEVDSFRLNKRPECKEAEKILTKIHGEKGESIKYKNGWRSSHRTYNKKKK